MSAAAVGIPRVGWTAVGVATAAAAAGGGLPAVALLVAGLLAIALGLSGLRVVRPAWSLSIVAAGVGALLLGLRVLIGPAAAPVPRLPEGGGPWHGAVVSMGSPRDGAQVARLALRSDTGEVIVAATLPVFPAVAAGAVVEVDGQLRPPPDDDGYGDYLRRTGASGTLEARSLRILEPAPLSLQTFRDGAGDALRNALPEPEAGLAAGILIGLRERVDRTLAADFATAGVSHVVAISGWNIAIVAGLVGAVMRGRSRRLVSIAILATVCAYVVAAGGSPSVVRAAVMAAVVLLARESGRAGRATTALGAAVTLLLLADPALVGDAGFRLSVLATAGLLAWANPLAERLGRVAGGRVPRWLAESLGISLAAQAATLPDVLATFGRLSLVAPVVNLAVVPLVPAAMAGGVLALAGGATTSFGAPAMIGTLVGLPGWLVLHLMVAIVRVGAALPFAAVTLPPGIAQLAGAVAAVAILALPRLWRARPRRMPQRRAGGAARPAPGARARSTTGKPRLTPAHRAGLVAGAILVALTAAAVGDASGRTTRITVLDVGQGDAILVETRTGARMLIDGGPDPDRTMIALDERIPPWDRRLDVVVLTHPHEDHVAGLARVLERYTVGRVYEPGMRGPGPGWAAWDARLHDGPPRGILATGARIRLGEVSLSVIWPDPGTVPLKPPDTGTSINNVSIVFLGEANGRRFLLMGDVEQGIDPTLLARGLPTVDFLKVAHHGSKTATTQAFLDVVRPRVAVASAGTGNPYGHPAPPTLERLRAAGARVYRTDRDGSVSVELREDGIRVTTTGGRRVAASGADPVLAGGGRAAAAALATTAGLRAPTTLFTCAIPIAWAAAPTTTPTAGVRWRRDLPGTTASAGPTGYDRGHDDPRAPRGRPVAALPRTADMVPAARVRRGGRGGGAGGDDPRERRHRRSVARGGGGPAPRRGQAAPFGSPGPAASRGGLCGLAPGPGHGGARTRGP